MQKILIIRLSSMGDVILTSPIVRQLKSSFPNAEIDFLTSNNFVDIFRYCPHINSIIPYNKKWKHKEIRQKKLELILNNSKKRYDLIVDLQNNRRSKSFAKGLGLKIISYPKNRLHKLSLVYLKKSLNIKHIYELYSQNLTDIISDDNLGLEIWLKSDKTEYTPFNKSISKKLNKIAIAPGAFHYTKRWLPERYAELIKLIKSAMNPEIILLGGESDKAICMQIKSLLDFEVFDYSGSNSILETAELLDDCDALITNDTGVMHISAARQIPTVAIFGSTVQEFGFTPFRVPHIIVETDLNCRPCTHIGRSKCPKGHFKCMKEIDATQVFSALINLAEH
jgi:lipopolysaccharide heptosyltransferase II